MAVCRFDAVGFEDIAHRRVTDLVADVRDCTLDSVEAPAWVLLCEAKHEIHDDLPDTWPTWFFPATLRVIPFLRYELSVPTEKETPQHPGQST